MAVENRHGAEWTQQLHRLRGVGGTPAHGSQMVHSGMCASTTTGVDRMTFQEITFQPDHLFIAQRRQRAGPEIQHVVESDEMDTGWSKLYHAFPFPSWSKNLG